MTAKHNHLIIESIVSVGLACLVSMSAMAAGPMRSACQYPVDGACAPKRSTWGWHQTKWRRMGDTIAAAVGKTAGALPADVPSVVLPDETEEDVPEPKLPTQSLPRATGIPLPNPAVSKDASAEDPFRDEGVQPELNGSPDALHEAEDTSSDMHDGVDIDRATTSHSQPATLSSPPKPGRYATLFAQPLERSPHPATTRGARRGAVSPFASSPGNPLRRTMGDIQPTAALEVVPADVEEVVSLPDLSLGRASSPGTDGLADRSRRARRPANNPLRGEN